jgi:MFS family permease
MSPDGATQVAHICHKPKNPIEPMQPDSAPQTSFTWLAFAFLTVACWGVYGIFLHNGQTQMGDPVNGRYKAFLFVGVAYFLVAVLAPLAVLKANGANWSFPATGMGWSLVAGIVGAVGAFGVLLAFGAAPKPITAYVPVVMSIIFAGAPVVNALVSIAIHPPAGGWAGIRWPFWLGIVLAAAGGALVTTFKPGSAPAKPPVTQTVQKP